MILRFLRRPFLLLALVLAAAMVPACRKPPPLPPVVHTAPVFTRPFEDGYETGFGKGRASSAYRAKIPSEAEVQSKAAEAVANDPALHDEKWQRGWAEGYVDGFREVATHQK